MSKMPISTTSLEKTELQRFSRQLVLADWSIAFQKQLNASAIYVDAPFFCTLPYLAALGIEKITLLSSDRPTPTDLKLAEDLGAKVFSLNHTRSEQTNHTSMRIALLSEKTLISDNLYQFVLIVRESPSLQLQIFSREADANLHSLWVSSSHDIEILDQITDSSKSITLYGLSILLRTMSLKLKAG
ncbi:hypothetical protein JNK13_10665 [bacterium]|nr:hypothetical protein [bacterium]